MSEETAEMDEAWGDWAERTFDPDDNPIAYALSDPFETN